MRVPRTDPTGRATGGTAPITTPARDGRSSPARKDATASGAGTAFGDRSVIPYPSVGRAGIASLGAGSGTALPAPPNYRAVQPRSRSRTAPVMPHAASDAT